MIEKIKHLFSRYGYVLVQKDGVTVRGTQLEYARMMVACMMALEKCGWDTSEMKVVMKKLAKRAERRAPNEENPHTI